MRAVAAGVVLIATALVILPHSSNAAADLSARFTKSETLVPMRDGVKLFTSIYAPRCDKDARGGQGAPAPSRSCPPLPIMLMRTPYGVAPYGPDTFPDALGPSEHFADGRFIIVRQDVRGRFMSEGTWDEMRPLDAAARGGKAADESTDAWDTIEWLLTHTTNNGRVGMWGVSYPGFYVTAGLAHAHPALVAASPQAPVTDYYMGDDAYHNGAYMLAANFGFYAGFYPRGDTPSTGPGWEPFEYGTRDGYRFFLDLGPLSNANTRYFHGRNPYWDATIDHTTYDDYWKARAVANHLSAVAPSVLTVGGWYDAEDLPGPLRVYHRIEETSPGTVNRLVMGPWTHGAWARGSASRAGTIELGADTARWYREHLEFPFFDGALHRGEAVAAPEAAVFDTGRHAWREETAWPPPSAIRTERYLGAGGRLSETPPRDATDAFDEYTSDPASPVPYMPPVIPPMVPGAWMTEDQRFADGRRDVLTYRGEPLASDVTVAGPIGVRLHVATTGSDADFVVIVIDEYPESGDLGLPGAFKRLVRGEPFRGRFRHSFERPQPFRPGEPDEVAFTMPDVFHTFRRGHRIVVRVQSTWFPLVDVNPQTYVDIPKATAADFRTATQRIYRSATRGSSVTIGVIK
jgi:putative CocE/NonD family hydrolase